MKVVEAKFVQDFIDLADEGYKMGWHERNGGNLTCRLRPEEVEQAAKYSPYLEIVFGPDYEVIPVLVLTRASDLFRFVPIGDTDAELPVCSGDMIFNVFNEYFAFLPD